MDQKTFFDSVSDEEAAKVAKWASIMCAGSSSPQDMFVRPFGLMFQADGPFLPVIRHLFKKVTVVGKTDDVPHGFECNLRHGECTLWASFAREHNVWNALGSKLDEVKFYKIRKEEFELVLRDVMQFCTQIKYMTNRCAKSAPGLVRELLSKYENSLEELKGFSVENLVGNSFPSLKVLSLSVSEVSVEQVRALGGVCDNLEELALSDSKGHCSWKPLFQAIRDLWTKLAIIRVTGRKIPHEEYETLLIWYSHRLRHANFEPNWQNFYSDADLASMCRVARHCPNLELTVRHSFSSSCDHLNLHRLAPQIVEIYDHASRRVNWQEFELFANRLEKLKKLTVSATRREAFRSLFAVPKPALEILELCDIESRMDDEIMQKMKKSKSNLKEFKLTISDMSASVVDQWCKYLEGSSNLKRVSLEMKGSRKEILESRNYRTSMEVALDRSNRFLFALRESEQLEFISIDIADAPLMNADKLKKDIKTAQLFRLRPVRVMICGFEMFLPPTTRSPSYLYMM